MSWVVGGALYVRYLIVAIRGTGVVVHDGGVNSGRVRVVHAAFKGHLSEAVGGASGA